ncbi:alginate lyase family protein [bacterium]|nr:alginate lyase family protein [bacterium]
MNAKRRIRVTLKAKLLVSFIYAVVFCSCTPDDPRIEQIQRWDLTRPGFEKVRVCLEQGNLESAQRLIVAYYEKRQTPWPVTPESIRLGFVEPELVLNEADQILDYRFSQLNETFQLTPPIDWCKNPSTNQEWIWAFNRHYEWKTLARAYVLTGQEKYARLFQELAHDWITRNPPLTEMNEASPTWRLIDVGLRMSENWINALSLLKDSEHVSWQVKWEILNSIYDHARFLNNWSTSKNHLLMEANGLASVVAYFPEFREAQAWSKVAFERLEKEAHHQVFPDGVHYECSTHYQWTVIDVLEKSLKLADLAGAEKVSKQLNTILQGMYRFLAYAVRPDGFPPMINDGVQRDIRILLNQAAERYDEPFFRMAANAETTTQQAFSYSQTFPYGGFTILRSGFVPNALYLFFDHGPLGGYHGHEDYLNFELYAFGAPLIVDPGTLTYDQKDPFRSYFLSSAAHNLVLINGYGQARRYNRLEPSDLEHRQADFQTVFGPNVDLATAEYTGPYGNDESIVYDCVRHRRYIFHVRPMLVIIADFITAPVHAVFTQLFHLDPALIAAHLNPYSGECLAFTPSVSLRIIPIGHENGLMTEIVSAEDAPIQGWYSPDYNILLPAPVVLFEQTGRDQTAFYTVLAPARGPQARLLTVEKLPLAVNDQPVPFEQGIALKISEADRIDYYIITDSLEGLKTAADFSTEDDISILRVQKGQPPLHSFSWSFPHKSE